MRIKYFEDTDTALFEIGTAPTVETRELSEDVTLDFDAQGHVVLFWFSVNWKKQAGGLRSGQVGFVV